MRSHGIDKDEAEKMLIEDEPEIKLVFDDKRKIHTWKYYPKKDWIEPPTMTNIQEPEYLPDDEPEVDDSDQSSSDNDEEPPEITCKTSKLNQS